MACLNGGYGYNYLQLLNPTGDGSFAFSNYDLQFNSFLAMGKASKKKWAKYG